MFLISMPSQPSADTRIKLMVFQPSERKLWTVIGNDREYWVDPDVPFCSCKDFYFSSLSGGELCYHLKSIDAAKNEGSSIEVVEFSDAEYPLVVQALAADAETILRD